MTTKELGELGERLAREYLVDNGYNILGKNWRINFGEIDIIAQKKLPLWQLFLRPKSPIHFVEVKTLRVSQGRQLEEDFFPEEKVNYKKQRKLKQLASLWLSKNKYPENYPYQIDIAGIVVNENTNIANLHYFKNAVETLN